MFGSSPLQRTSTCAVKNKSQRAKELTDAITFLKFWKEIQVSPGIIHNTIYSLSMSQGLKRLKVFAHFERRSRLQYTEIKWWKWCRFWTVTAVQFSQFNRVMCKQYFQTLSAQRHNIDNHCIVYLFIYGRNLQDTNYKGQKQEWKGIKRL